MADSPVREVAIELIANEIRSAAADGRTVEDPRVAAAGLLDSGVVVLTASDRSEIEQRASGAHICDELVKIGYALVINDDADDRLTILEDGLRALGFTQSNEPGDVSEPAPEPTFHSICSAHQTPDPSCEMCKVGFAGVSPLAAPEATA